MGARRPKRQKPSYKYIIQVLIIDSEKIKQDFIF